MFLHECLTLTLWNPQDEDKTSVRIRREGDKGRRGNTVAGIRNNWEKH